MVQRLSLWLAALCGALGALLFVVGQPGSATTGGPDGCGYYFADTAAPGGPAYNFVDIQGTNPGPAVDDSPPLTVTLPFSFTFCGTSYSSVKLASNGYICFVAAGCSDWTPNPIPAGSFSDPNMYVAGYWTDLYTFGCNCAWYNTIGTAPNRVFIYEEANTPYCCSASPTAGTWEIKLFETTNVIEVHYQTMAPDSHFALAGIQDNNGNSGLTYLSSSNPAQWAALSGTAVRYTSVTNQPPVATPQTVNVNEDCSTVPSTHLCATPATITLTGTDPDVADSRYYCIAAQPLHGALQNAPPTCPTYSPAPSPTLDIQYAPAADYCNGFTGSFTSANDDVFTFKVHDGTVFSSAAPVRIEVGCVADAPTATDDFYTLFENCSPSTSITSCSAAAPPYFAVASGCSTPPLGIRCSVGEMDADDLQVPAPSPLHSANLQAVLVDGPQYGTLLNYDGSGINPTISPDGGFRYRPNDHTCGPDTFTYRLLDDNSPGGLAPPAYGNLATVTLTVTCTGSVPTAVPDQYVAASGFTMDTQQRQLAPLLANDFDPEGDPLQAVWCSGPSVGTLGAPPYSPANPPIRPSGQFSYTPPAGFLGVATFSYRARDNTGHASACATVQITVQADRAPQTRFSWTPDAGEAGAPVQFRDESSDPDVGDYPFFWAWAFGDGSTSGQRSPSHAFGEPGTQNVCLSVADSYGKWGQPVCHDVMVNAPPKGQGQAPPEAPPQEQPAAPDEEEVSDTDLHVSAGPDLVVHAGDAVALSAVVTGASSPSYSWAQLDQNARVELSGAQTSVVTFAAPAPVGDSVVLYFAVAAQSGSQQDSDAVMVTVQRQAGSAAAAIAGPATGVVGQAIVLDGSASTGQGPLSYHWLQLGGATAAASGTTGAQASFTPAAAGEYLFGLQVTAGSATDLELHAVTVLEPAAPVVVDENGFTLVTTPSGAVIATPTVAAASYEWDFGDGQHATTSGEATHVYTEAGSFSVKMTVQASGAPATYTHEATVALSAARGVGSQATASAAVPVWAWALGAVVLVGGVGAIVAYTLSRRKA